MSHDLDSEVAVVNRPIAGGGVVGDWLDMKGRFRKADVFPDHRGAHFSFKAGAQLGENFLGVLGAVIDAASDDASDFEERVEPLLHDIDGLEELDEAVQRHDVRFHGDEHFISHGEGVEGEEAKRGGAVDENVIPGLVGEALDLVFKDAFSGHFIGKRFFNTSEELRRWDHTEVLDLGLFNGVFELAVFGKDLVEPFALLFKPVPQRG